MNWWYKLKQLTLRQQQKWIVKKQMLNEFQNYGCCGLRFELRNSDIGHDYAQIAKCGDLELAISLSNRKRIRIYIRSHNTDQSFLARLEALARGKMSSIHNDTIKKSCDVLELKETFDWHNLGPCEFATLQGDIQIVASVWNEAIGVL